MKRTAITFLIIMLMLICTACSPEDPVNSDESINEQPIREEQLQVDTDAYDDTSEETVAAGMTLTINEEQVNVIWEENESVNAFMEMALQAPVVINMSKYGGFEQVGELGASLPRNDESIEAGPGDIMLYTGSSIVVFYGHNSWSYTRLGHIEDKNSDELRELLGGKDVVITIAVH